MESTGAGIHAGRDRGRLPSRERVFAIPLPAGLRSVRGRLACPPAMSHARLRRHPPSGRSARLTRPPLQAPLRKCGRPPRARSNWCSKSSPLGGRRSAIWRPKRTLPTISAAAKRSTPISAKSLTSRPNGRRLSSRQTPSPRPIACFAARSPGPMPIWESTPVPKPRMDCVAHSTAAAHRRHDGHLANVHARYAHEIGLASRRGTRRVRYAPNDQILRSLVFANVERRMEFQQFLAVLHQRYGFVIGHRQAG